MIRIVKIVESENLVLTFNFSFLLNILDILMIPYNRENQYKVGALNNSL